MGVWAAIMCAYVALSAVSETGTPGVGFSMAAEGVMRVQDHEFILTDSVRNVQASMHQSEPIVSCFQSSQKLREIQILRTSQNRSQL